MTKKNKKMGLVLTIKFYRVQPSEAPLSVLSAAGPLKRPYYRELERIETVGAKCYQFIIDKLESNYSHKATVTTARWL